MTEVDPVVGDWYRRENERLRGEVEGLRQALWDVYGILGFDQDGDATPAAIVSDLGLMVRKAADEWRKERDEEVEEYDQILGRQTELLRGVANALKGEPPPLGMHDQSDLPQLAGRLMDDLADALDIVQLFDVYDAVPDDHGYVGSGLQQRVAKYLARMGKPPLSWHGVDGSQSAEPQPHQPHSPDATTNQTSRDRP